MKDLSVLLPIYNAGRYPAGWVDRAINSVLYQDIDAEVCIGDDGSTDDYLSRYQDERIKIVRHENGPTGGSDAANLAGDAAEGRYFLILSCRSWYEPGSLKQMVRFLDRREDIGFVYGQSAMHLVNGTTYLKSPPAYSPEQWRHSFPWSFGYMYRREAWDCGCRYGITVYAENEKRYFTIGDHHMMMHLIHTMKYRGDVLNALVLHYQYGVIPQEGDFLAKYKRQLQAEFERAWSGV